MSQAVEVSNAQGVRAAFCDVALRFSEETPEYRVLTMLGCGTISISRACELLVNIQKGVTPDFRKEELADEIRTCISMREFARVDFDYDEIESIFSQASLDDGGCAYEEFQSWAANNGWDVRIESEPNDKGKRLVKIDTK